VFEDGFEQAVLSQNGDISRLVLAKVLDIPRAAA
jgi:hypothetical protein